MSAVAKPVWVWLPGRPEPMECGLFTLEGSIGQFEYRQSYVDDHDLALDPVHLGVGGRSKTIREQKQDGLFGVIRDAKPEGYGLDLLAQVRKVGIDDHMAVLEESEGDSVGAIAVCDDVTRKQAFHCPRSEDLLAILAAVPETRPASDAVREVQGLVGTSAGGERPKLTVLHEGQQWLAKLQDRGDRPHSPLREFVAMKVAAALGVKTAEVQFRRVFDIAPYGLAFSGTQSMDLSRSRTNAASSAVFNLIDACPDYGYDEDEARAYISRVRGEAPRLWAEQVMMAGYRQDDLPFEQPVWLDAERPADASPRRGSRRP